MGDVLQPLEMLGPDGVQAEIKKPEIPVHPGRRNIRKCFINTIAWCLP